MFYGRWLWIKNNFIDDLFKKKNYCYGEKFVDL